MQYRIDASDDWQAQNGQVASIVADAIVQSYESSINQFINNQRQQSRLGIIEQQRHQMTLPGIGVDYASNQGNETIRITVKPEYVNLAQLPLVFDLNYDGYVAYVHSWQQLQSPAVDNAPVDIILNGYGLLTNYTPDDDLLALYDGVGLFAPTVEATVMFIAAFGNTALRCQSLQDAAKLNTFAAAKGSGGPLNAIIPARKKIPANGNAPAHADLPGYFVFNWNDGYNPDSWAFNGDQGTGPGFTFGANFPVPDIIKIIQFKDTTKSPLKATGTNALYSQYSSTPAVGTGQNAVDFYCAEFYNRASLRVVTTSWNHANNSGGIIVNDEPLYFGVDGGNPFSDTGAATNFTMNFDLTPQKSPLGACTFGTSSATAEVLNTLTADQQAVLAENAAAARIYGAAYNSALLALNTAQQALVVANQNIITPSRGSDITLAYAYAAHPSPTILAEIAADIGETAAVALVTYAQASVAFQQHPTSESYLRAFNAAENNLGAAASLVVGDYLGILASQSAYSYSVAYNNAYNAATAAGADAASAAVAGANALATALAGLNSTENALISYANSQGETTLANAASTALATMISAENALIAVQQNYQPAVVQSDNYKSIQQFNYRVITVTMINGKATNYVFGAWSQG